MNTKSKICFGKKTGEPLTEYHNVMDARQAAAYVSKIRDTKMVEYECGKCGKWHLSPADRQTPSVYCSYCDKELYTTEQAAQRRSQILREEKGIQLKWYPCGDGWHLTKC